MVSKSKYILIYWVPIFIYCLLIFIQSSYPSVETIPTFLFSDKLLHFSAYALLGILFFRAFETFPALNNHHLTVALSILCAGLYGASDEIHQYFVPGRNADIMDLAADFTGSFAGVIIYRYILNNYKENRY